jgi:hypothetical protein
MAVLDDDMAAHGDVASSGDAATGLPMAATTISRFLHRTASWGDVLLVATMILGVCCTATDAVVSLAHSIPE